MSMDDFLNDENSSKASSEISPVTTTPIVLYLSPKEIPDENDNKENEDAINSAQEEPDSKKLSFDEKRPFSCNICNKTYKRSFHLKMHLFTHSDERPYKCKFCSKSFTHSYYLRQHELLHSSEEKFSCHICDKKFSVLRYFTRHLRSHKKRYSCDACDFDCDKLKFINDHIKTHCSDLYTCEKCDRLFCHEGSKISHECFKSDLRRYSCNLCPKTFKKIWDQEIHLAKHANKKSIICDICKRGFNYKELLKRHMETHYESNPEKPHSCPICYKKFHLEKRLERHIRFHTRKNRNPRKSNCQNSEGGKKDQKNKLHGQIGYLNIDYPVNLTTPIYFIPGNKKVNYVCNVCFKGFRYKYNFTLHYRTHTGEKPFQCEVCSKCFTAKTDLKRHFRTHTGERKYVCENCNKTFTRKGYLRDHLQKCKNQNSVNSLFLPKIVSVHSEFQDAT